MVRIIERSDKWNFNKLDMIYTKYLSAKTMPKKGEKVSVGNE